MKRIALTFAYLLLGLCAVSAQNAREEDSSASVTQTAQSMAEQQADHLDRKLNLTERQREKVIRMFMRFNENFMERRQQQIDSDQSDIRAMLQQQVARKNRELKRILTVGQYEKYLEGMPENNTNTN